MLCSATSKFRYIQSIALILHRGVAPTPSTNNDIKYSATALSLKFRLKNNKMTELVHKTIYPNAQSYQGFFINNITSLRWLSRKWWLISNNFYKQQFLPEHNHSPCDNIGWNYFHIWRTASQGKSAEPVGEIFVSSNQRILLASFHTSFWLHLSVHGSDAFCF